MNNRFTETAPRVGATIGRIVRGTAVLAVTCAALIVCGGCVRKADATAQRTTLAAHTSSDCAGAAGARACAGTVSLIVEDLRKPMIRSLSSVAAALGRARSAFLLSHSHQDSASWRTHGPRS